MVEHILKRQKIKNKFNDDIDQGTIPDIPERYMPSSKEGKYLRFLMTSAIGFCD